MQDRVFQELPSSAVDGTSDAEDGQGRSAKVIPNARVLKQYMDELCSHKLRRSRCEARYALTSDLVTFFRYLLVGGETGQEFCQMAWAERTAFLAV
jgi:hypothetical protein